MCLISQRGVPFTAQRDIKVIKAVKKNDNGSFVTPYQGMAAVPGSMMVAEGEKECEPYNDLKYEINGGYIHSKIAKDGGYDSGIYGIVSYIPKGKKYYISQCMDDVCSEELLLTNEVMTGDELLEYDARNEITLPIIRDLLDGVDRTTVSSGWIVLSDRTFIHPLDYDGGRMTAIGVVCCIKDGKVLITALDEAYLQWHHDDIEPVNEAITNKETTLSDMNGREYTKRIVNSDTYKNDDTSYAAVRYCAEYETEGAEKGEWYLPSTGELAFMYFYEMDIINATLTLLGKKIINSWYWASAEYSSTGAWHCSTNYAYVCNDGKWYSSYVRPSFSLSVED